MSTLSNKNMSAKDEGKTDLVMEEGMTSFKGFTCTNHPLKALVSLGCLVMFVFAKSTHV